MSNQISRWSCLTILAIANLVFWIAVAVVVGLAASDTVNLGIETFVREHQATLATLWKPAPPRASGLATRPLPAIAVERAANTTTQPMTATPSPPLRLQATLTVKSGTATSPQPTPSRSQPTTPPDSSPPIQRASPTTQPTPTPALLSSPLLLADPSFSNLMGIDAEMSRSIMGRAVQIRYGEGMLNRELASWLADYPDLPYHDLQVQLHRDQVVVQGIVTVLGFEVNTEVTGILLARDCLPQAEVQSISIAGILTPGLVKKEIEKIILESLSWYPANYPLCLEQIVVEEGRITVYGTRR